MKFLVSRIQKQLRSGISKTGNPYSMDHVDIVVSVPLSTSDAFGSKELVYQYGTASDFDKLDVLRSSLPCDVDLELGTIIDTYGNPKTVVTSVKPISVVSHLNK